MLEKKDPWLLDEHIFFDESIRVESPWTGTQLLLRPFLQACFVWYGLLNFWSNPDVLSNLPETEVLHMARRAHVGFTKGSLVDKVKQWRNSIDTDVLDAIETLQQTVV
jgi:hypothetical protein